MTYDQVVSYLLALGRELAAPRQARVQKFGLENITALAKILGEPQRRHPCAHIAGTNGKGSTAAFLDSILRETGMRTGLYTSPHLERINERIRISGNEISDMDFAKAGIRIIEAIECGLASGELVAHPTYFECVTAMAFDYFAGSELDFAIYEVGMGGRLDATNIVMPEVTVITQIALDHENFLGHSIPEIASEKAGIIKEGKPVICSAENPEALEVIRGACAARKARLLETDKEFQVRSLDTENGCVKTDVYSKALGMRLHLAIPLPGRFQLRNTLTAVAAAALLAERGFPVSAEAIERGIARTRWLGRLERLGAQPLVYLDGAHNPAAVRELRRFWEEELAGRRIFLVYGAVRDKAVDEVAGILFPHAERVILTQPLQSRAISAPVLAELTSHHARSFEVIPEAWRALEAALAGANEDDVVFVTGSLYMAGEIRRYWRERESRPSAEILTKQDAP